MTTSCFRVTTFEGEENIYDAVLTHHPGSYMFQCYVDGKATGKLIIFSQANVLKIESFVTDPEGDDDNNPTIIVPHNKFKAFCQTVELFDRWQNGEFDPASKITTDAGI